MKPRIAHCQRAKCHTRIITVLTLARWEQADTEIAHRALPVRDVAFKIFYGVDVGERAEHN